MLFLRRDYYDGAESPELVLLHGEVISGRPGDETSSRCTRVVVPSGGPGRRVAYIPLPEPRKGESAVVRYRFSVARGGAEWYSPQYEVEVPSDDLISDLYHVAEEAPGNLPPAPGRGYFRTVLPLAEGEPSAGLFRYGFGAMRKKPSHSLCRAAVDAGGGPAPVVEIPEALSVLKNRPMPYYLYHVSGDGALRASKIACARIAVPDPAGDVVSARLVWGDSGWRAANVSPMEAKGFPPGPGVAAEEFFAADRDGYLAARAEALSRIAGSRVFEAFVFGASGARVEYCLHTVRRRGDGALAAEWKNREGGGNWEVVL
jgi:hypothetical protein